MFKRESDERWRNVWVESISDLHDGVRAIAHVARAQAVIIAAMLRTDWLARTNVFVVTSQSLKSRSIRHSEDNCQIHSESVLTDWLTDWLTCMNVSNIDHSSASDLHSVTVGTEESERVHLDVPTIPLSPGIVRDVDLDVHEGDDGCWRGSLGRDDEIRRNRHVPDGDVLQVARIQSRNRMGAAQKRGGGGT
jgi:hypothetical protein